MSLHLPHTTCIVAVGRDFPGGSLSNPILTEMFIDLMCIKSGRRSNLSFLGLAKWGTRASLVCEGPVIPAGFCFSQTMPFSMKKLIFNDFFCRTGIKIPAKPDKKSTKKISKNLVNH
ncbi:MAG: hypothetical protein OXD29_07385 [Roseovarius sp.]|nr:hypothetical protein [Roseovarius sp.]